MLVLKKLSVTDGQEIYEMLQGILAVENEFKNTAYGLSYEAFKEWLKVQDSWSKGEQLPKGYVAQSMFWLMDEGIPVGCGKIRHALNDDSRRVGGNIGYAIDERYRGRGYATQLLKLLLEEANRMGIKEILLTVEKCNPASKCVIEKNGGYVFKENKERWYFCFKDGLV